MRSGPFSWTRSAPASACARSAVNLRFDGDAPVDRPNRLSAGHAVSTNFLSAVSAFGAMSVATTCSPWPRTSVVQLATSTRVPMMAMRRMGLFCDISLLLRDFGICDAGEVALRVEEIALARPVEPSGIDRTGEVGDEHPVTGNVERDTDPLHEMGHHDLRLDRLVVDRGPAHCVAARRVAAVGPVENTVLVVELEIDRLRQTVEEDLDVGPGGCSLAGGNLDIGTEEAAEPGIVWAFLCPVDMSEFRVDRQPNAPSRLVPAIGVAVAGLD